MAYFPAFIKLDNIDILIVGGGYIASEKLEHLLDFTKNIKIIAPLLNNSMKQMISENNLVYENRIYTSPKPRTLDAQYPTFSLKISFKSKRSTNHKRYLPPDRLVYKSEKNTMSFQTAIL
jgi:siroheme synthase (precorrin-2 oxidase/ferrochelatase)